VNALYNREPADRRKALASRFQPATAVANPRMTLLEFRDVHKSFGAVHALGGVSLAVDGGEAHALVGENGAGKSTLLNLVGGVLRPDRGELFWKGQPLALKGPRDALAHGIGLVHQEMLSFPNLSVSANIFAGRELTTRGGRLRERDMHERTREILGRLQLEVAAEAPMESLSAAHRQLVQVARALAFECSLLVLDEPTTSLTGAEAEHLFGVLEALRARGVTLLYVSHRLVEVFRLCDRITVLRDGRLAGAFERRQATPGQVVQAMVGRELPPRTAAPAAVGGAPVLRLERLTRRPRRRRRAGFEDVSLEVRAGEIVALFGLVGSGRTELLETIFGLARPRRGEIVLSGERLVLAGPRDAARRGIALVPEERQRQGLFFNLSVRHNLLLPRQAAAGASLIRSREERRRSEAIVRDWGIRASSVEAAPQTLSGGNQQKVMLAKWLALEPRLLLLDEPTKGVDVGAKFEIHEIVRRQAAAGAACLIASSDLPEVLALADRIVVMREGCVAGELPAGGATEEAVMRLATGERESAA
jgi:ABC-type sugar transport system ATPase subunit